MSNQPNQKLKLLYLLEILLKKADVGAGISMNEILGELAARGIDAERKSVCRDFDVLREYGWDVLFDSSTKRWFWPSAPFRLKSWSCSSMPCRARRFLPSTWLWDL